MNRIIFPPSMVNSQADEFLWAWLSNQCKRRKTDLKSVKLHLKTDPVSYPARAEGLSEYIYNFGNNYNAIDFFR